MLRRHQLNENFYGDTTNPRLFSNINATESSLSAPLYLKEARQLRIAIWDELVPFRFLAQRGDDVAEREKSEVDGHTLLETDAGRVGLVGPFRSGQVDQMELGDDAVRKG